MNARKQQILHILSLRKQKQNFLEDKMSVTNFKFGNIIIVSIIVIFHLQVFNLILNDKKKINKRRFYQA